MPVNGKLLFRIVNGKVSLPASRHYTDFCGLIGVDVFTSDSAFSTPIGLVRQRRVSLLGASVVHGHQLRLGRLLQRIENPRHDGQLVQELRNARVCRKKPRKGLGNLFQEAQVFPRSMFVHTAICI